MTIEKVIKRDGTEEPLDISKALSAASKAFASCGRKLPSPVASKIQRLIEEIDRPAVTVEEIQDIIEKTLLDSRYDDVAKSFIIYRYEHKQIREYTSKKIQFIEEYRKASCNADATVDDNANVSMRSVGVLNAEIHKSDNIQVSRQMIMSKLKELYPDFDSKQYVRDLQGPLYKHDESSFVLPVPYCCSVTMYPMLLDGISKLGGISKAPSSLESFCGIYINMIFMLSSNFAGAVATSEFLLYFDYFCRKEWGNGYIDKLDEMADGPVRSHPRTIRQRIHQCFQQVVYSINQPMGSRGLQSAFVNFSYFDKPFFDGMFSDFVFPDGDRPLWNTLKWLQKEFMMWFNEERLKHVFTFPVESFTLLYKDGKFQDPEMYEFVCEEFARGHSFFVYISDTVDSLSSCCFEGDEILTIYDSKEDRTFFTSIMDFVNEYMPDSDESGLKIAPRYRIMSIDKEGLALEMTDITGVLKKEYSGEMIHITTSSGKAIEVTEDHLLLVKDKESDTIVEIPAAQFKRYPDRYLIAVTDEREHMIQFEEAKVTGVRIVNKKPVYDIELKDNHLFSANNIVTHNCRLRNSLVTKEFSFTNGNMGIQTGSVSVITLDLNRITQDAARSMSKGKALEKGSMAPSDEFYARIKEDIRTILSRVYKYHMAYRAILEDELEAGLLPAYRAGFIDMTKQYMTVGINGLNEAAEFMGLELNDNPGYSRFCQEIFSTIKQENQTHRDKTHMFNTEMVPAESASHKLYMRDKNDGYWVPNDRNLYASYVFLSSDPSVSLMEKIRLHGRRYIGDWLDGGSAAHLNLDAHLSKVQYERVLEYAAQEGCSYLTFNIPNSECDQCGYITKHPIDRCPKCGSDRITAYDRVIGYLVPVKNWNTARQVEQKTRIYEHIGGGEING